LRKRKVRCREEIVYEDNVDLRRHFPEMSMTVDDVQYIKELARRENTSCSYQVEKIIKRVVLIYGFKRENPFVMPKSKKDKTFLRGLKIRRRPKYTVHPAYTRVLGFLSQKENMSLSTVFYCILSQYRRLYPVYLDACC